MAWELGREAVSRMIDEGEIERVQPNEALADRLLKDAEAHLESARALMSSDASGALQLSYDAARKACTAVLAVQGLRPTSNGGHRALQEVLMEQFGRVFSDFGRLRRARQESEYPDERSSDVDEGEAGDVLGSASDIVSRASALLAEGDLTPFRG